MSRPGFRSAAEAKCVREMVARGWQRVGRNGQGHQRLVWPATGAVLTIPGKGPEQLFAKVSGQARKLGG